LTVETWKIRPSRGILTAEHFISSRAHTFRVQADPTAAISKHRQSVASTTGQQHHRFYIEETPNSSISDG